MIKAEDGVVFKRSYFNRMGDDSVFSPGKRYPVESSWKRGRYVTLLKIQDDEGEDRIINSSWVHKAGFLGFLFGTV